MGNEIFELSLLPSREDPPKFGEEYQKELRELSKKAQASSQRAFVMDSAIGGGGPLGEFCFENAGKLITALTTIVCVWIRARNGRKVRLKVGDVQLEASNVEDIGAMVKFAEEIQYANSKNKKSK